MRIRAAVAADAPALAAIYAHYVATSVATFDTEAPDAAAMAEKLAALQAAGHPFVVAEDGGAILGYGYASPYRPRPAYRFTVEDSVYVAPEARGRGAGRALLDAVLDGARATGAREVVAVIAEGGDPASVALHRACGFRDGGRLERVGFKFGRWIDTILMQRSL